MKKYLMIVMAGLVLALSACTPTGIPDYTLTNADPPRLVLISPHAW